jgi:hypothetical protein
MRIRPQSKTKVGKPEVKLGNQHKTYFEELMFKKPGT